MAYMLSVRLSGAGFSELAEMFQVMASRARLVCKPTELYFMYCQSGFQKLQECTPGLAGVPRPMALYKKTGLSPLGGGYLYRCPPPCPPSLPCPSTGGHQETEPAVPSPGQVWQGNSGKSSRQADAPRVVLGVPAEHWAYTRPQQVE